MRKKILSAGPSISEREVNYVCDAVRNGWYEKCNDYIRKFEKEFAVYLGVKYAIATSSCTGAMHIALAALRIKEGDEVIVPETTWVQTAAVVKYVGAIPVFVDVDRETWTINPENLRRAITSRTKGIIPVHLYGHPADMDPVLKIAREYSLFVLEDAAPSIGAEYRGKKTGGFGDFGAFSFQGAKLLVTGEGGMLVTDSDKLYERASFLANQGRDSHIQFWINEIGLKYKMSNIQAALGLAQLERIDELLLKKRNIYSWYKNRLDTIEALRMSTEMEWARSTHWMTSAILTDKAPIGRSELMRMLSERGIDTRPLFPPISSFPMFKKENNPVAEYVGSRGINLPCACNLREEDIDFVCENINSILGEQ